MHARELLDTPAAAPRRQSKGAAPMIALLLPILLSVLLGIRVLARTRPQREVLEGAASGLLALLGKGS